MMRFTIEQISSNYPSNGWHRNRLNKTNSQANLMCMLCVLMNFVLLYLVGHSVFCYTNYSQWATYPIRQFNHPKWSNIWRAENDCRNPNHYVLRKCIYILFLITWFKWECFQIWPDAVVLECGRKWTTEICRHSSRVGNNSGKDIRQFRLLYAVDCWEWRKSKTWGQWAVVMTQIVV